MKDRNLSDLIRENIWHLLTALVVIATIWAYTKSRVDANYEAINELRGRIDEYPSSDYFDLKFNMVDKRLDDQDKKLDAIDQKIQSHFDSSR